MGDSKMRDDFLTRDWADHHGSFAVDINKLLRTISTNLARLHEYQFDAPWRARAGSDRGSIEPRC
jgi:hypothetical protein